MVKYRSRSDQAADILGVTIPQLSETIDDIGEALEPWVDRPGIMLGILLQCAWELVKSQGLPDPKGFLRERVEEVFDEHLDALH